jgi:conjugative transfer signal peptidase TraF
MLIWNVSPSQPIGLYRTMRGPPRVSDRVLVRLPPHLADLAARRGYLAPSTYLIKPVAAVNGDRVCRLGTHIFVRGRIMARALLRDRQGRALPTWQGCHNLRPGELFLLAADPDSFDSRYFSAVSTDAVTGRASLIWSLAPGGP